MVAGAALFQLAKWVLAEGESRGLEITLAPTATTHPSRIAKTTLPGPDGLVSLPGSRKTVVHVWLQGCQDCMPTFEAMQRIEESGGLKLDARVVNVSYGEADPAWAARFGVRENLATDSGGAKLVRPLGITTFTTLVVDTDGTILHRDRPDRPGYAERLREIVGQAAPSPSLAPPTPSLRAEDVQRVVAGRRAALKRTCWDHRAAAGPPTVKIKLDLVVGTTGEVVSASATGDDALVASCVEEQARGWLFPAHRERSGAIQIPFVFTRE